MSRIVEVTTVVGCPMLCTYCPQDKLRRAYGDAPRRMTLKLFRECLAKLPADVIVNFAGMAEPWANPECTEMVLAAAEHGTVAVFTSLVGMTPEDVRRIQYIPFKHFCIHLPDTERRMRVDVTPEYLEVLERCWLFPAADLIVYGTLHPQVKDRLGFNIASSEHRLGSRAGNVGEGKKLEGTVCCSSSNPPRHVVLLPDGRVVLCCMDYGMRHVLGNLVEQPYEELFQGPAYEQVLAGLAGGLPVLCHSCENAKQL